MTIEANRGAIPSEAGLLGCRSKREIDVNSYRLGMRDGYCRLWMTRPSQITETNSTRRNYLRGYLDGQRFSPRVRRADSTQGEQTVALDQQK